MLRRWSGASNGKNAVGNEQSEGCRKTGGHTSCAYISDVMSDGRVIHNCVGDHDGDDCYV